MSALAGPSNTKGAESALTPSSPEPAAGSSKPAESRFALARIGHSVCLVERPCALRLRPSHILTSVTAPAASSALAPLHVRVFAHEFAGVFRFAHVAAVHPAEFALLEALPPGAALADPAGGGAVYVARDVMARVARMTAPAPAPAPRKPPARARRVVRGWNGVL
jgi:hypothetical protein